MADETVSVREIDIDVLVDALEGEDRFINEVAYCYSNGREFKDKGADSTLYNPS
jgi:hypothetical protein